MRVDLKENPANMIWLWGQGTRPRLPSFQEKYGVKGAIVSAVDLVNGIGKIIGLEVIKVPGATGYYDTNYQGKADYAVNALKSKDFVFVHVEATDEAGHNKDIRAKITAIENFPKREKEVIIPNDRHDLIAGFSYEAIEYHLGGTFRGTYYTLNDNIINGRIRGVGGVVG